MQSDSGQIQLGNPKLRLVEASDKVPLPGICSDMVISQRWSQGRTAESPNSNLLTRLASELTCDAGRQGPSNKLDSGWSVFRMLLHSDQCGGEDIEKIRQKTGAQIGIYPVAGVNVVMVSAKEESALSTPPAVHGFVEVHKYFLDSVNYFYSGSPFCLTRLLVPDAQASSLIASNMIKTIARESHIVSISYRGNVILELMGIPEGVNKAVALIASYLRGFTVDDSVVSTLEACGGSSVPNIGLSDGDGDMAFVLSANNLGTFEESMVSELEDQSGFPTPNYGEQSSNRGGDVGGFLHYDTLKAQRRKTVRHVANIPMSYVSHVIGHNGKNIQSMRQKCSATIILGYSRRNQVQMAIEGGSRSEVEKARKVMEDLTGGLPLFQRVSTSVVLCEAVHHRPNLKIAYAKDVPAIAREL